MNIIVYYPKCEQDIKALQKKVAKVHADAVIHHIQKLKCPKEQKMKLYEEIKTAYREKNG